MKLSLVLTAFVVFWPLFSMFGGPKKFNCLGSTPCKDSIFYKIFYDSCYTKHIPYASSNEDVDVLLSQGNKSVLYIDSSEGVISRFYLLSGSRMLQVSSFTTRKRKPNRIMPDDVRYLIAIHCYDSTKLSSKKPIECYVDCNGMILALTHKYHIDPEGKEAIVMYDKQLHNEVINGTLSIKTNGNPVVFCTDLIVIRYRQEIKTILQYLYKK